MFYKVLDEVSQANLVPATKTLAGKQQTKANRRGSTDDIEKAVRLRRTAFINLYE